MPKAERSEVRDRPESLLCVQGKIAMQGDMVHSCSAPSPSRCLERQAAQEPGHHAPHFSTGAVSLVCRGLLACGQHSISASAFTQAPYGMLASRGCGVRWGVLGAEIPGVTHVVHPFGAKGDPDDGQEYLRCLEKRCFPAPDPFVLAWFSILPSSSGVKWA